MFLEELLRNWLGFARVSDEGAEGGCLSGTVVANASMMPIWNDNVR